METLTSIKELKYYCQCGNVNMSAIKNSHEFYCCNQMEPCQLRNGTITCTDGVITNINDKCGGVCPTADLMSEIALSTNQYTHKQNDGMCYAYGNVEEDEYERLYYNKIFMDSDSIKDQENFAVNFCFADSGTQSCVGMEKRKYEYDQCFTSVVQ